MKAVRACLGLRCLFRSVLVPVLPQPSSLPRAALSLPTPARPHGPVVSWIAAVGPENWNPIWKMGVSGKEAGDNNGNRECLICFTPKPASPQRASLLLFGKRGWGRRCSRLEHLDLLSLVSGIP